MVICIRYWNVRSLFQSLKLVKSIVEAYKIIMGLSRIYLKDLVKFTSVKKTILFVLRM